MTLKYGFGIQANFIFGDVAETKETAKETLDYWKKKCGGQIGLGFIQPYPGSEIYKHCLRNGIIKNRLKFIENDIATGLWLNMTDKMSDEEVKELKEEILDSVSEYCEFVRPNSIKKDGKNSYEVEVKCPYCNKIVNYKNCYIKNKLTYGFYIVCRECHMRFFIVSLLQKIAYNNYSRIITLRDLQKAIIKKIKKKMV